MEGYVQNESSEAYFILQRQIPPGGKVSLENAYKSVGKRSGLEEGPDFVEWLRTSVLNRGAWGFYDKEGKPLKSSSGEKITVTEEPFATKTSSDVEKDAKGAGRVLRRDGSEDAKGVAITPSAIIEASYEQARVLIEKTRDRVVLKKALALTQHFSGKEQHMRHLIKRLEQIY